MTAARKTSKASTARSSGSQSRSKRADKGRTSTAKGRAAQSKKTTAKKATSGAKRAASGAAKKTTRKPVAKKTTAARKTTSSKTRAAKTPAPRARKTTSGAARVVGGRRGQARGNERARVPTRPGAAAKKPPGRPARPIKFDKKQLAAIRAELGKELEDLERQQQELEQSSFTDTQSDLTGEVGLDEDFADAGTATFERERDLSIKNNIRDLIDQITRAIGRIDDGVYGVCERCGGPIDAARLKALPHAVLCMDCKRREERAR